MSMTMTDKQWIAIDPSRFRRTVEQKIGAATVVSSASPYSVPQAMSTYDDKQSGAYVLEVKYIGAEEPTETLMAENLRFMRGKNSGRLLKVYVGHTSSMVDREHIVQAVKDAIARIDSKYGPTDNYKIVSAVIEENKNRFLISGIEQDEEKA